LFVLFLVGGLVDKVHPAVLDDVLDSLAVLALVLLVHGGRLVVGGRVGVGLVEQGLGEREGRTGLERAAAATTATTAASQSGGPESWLVGWMVLELCIYLFG